MKKLIFILVIYSIKSFACTSISLPKDFNIVIDTDNKSVNYYNNKYSSKKSPNISLDSCSQLARQKKYVMFALALENFKLSDLFLTYSINDLLIYQSDDMCRIENTETQLNTSRKYRNDRLFNKRKFVTSCLSFNVSDLAKSGLSIPEKQIGCEVKRIDKSNAEFRGNFCFIQPKPDSRITITAKVKDSCLSKDHYKNNNFSLQDVLGSIELYTAGNTTGRAGDLDSTAASRFRLSINPDKELTPKSVPIKEADPQWPTSWQVSDVNLGEPIFEINSKDKLTLSTPVLVNNQCERICKDELCSSPCDYTQPLSAEVTLNRISNGKKEYMTSWYDGGMIPAQWTGFINGAGKSLSRSIFKDDEVYSLEVNLEDQEYNYSLLKNRVKKIIRSDGFSLPKIYKEGRKVGTFNSFPNLDNISTLPTYDSFDSIQFAGGIETNVKSTVNSISRMFNNLLWPPYFEQYCTEAGCTETRNHKLRLEIDFKLVEDKPVILSYRKVKGNNTQIIDNYKAPYITCKDPNDTDDDYDDDDDDSDDVPGDFDF